LKDRSACPDPEKKAMITTPVSAKPTGASRSFRYNLRGALPRATVVKLMQRAMKRGVIGDVDETPTSSPKRTIVSFNQLFRCLRGLMRA